MINLHSKLETAIFYANSKQREAQDKNKVWYDKKARAITYKTHNQVNLQI